METAWIDGKPASPEDALRAAGELLDAGRLPLVTGLRTDVAGLRAAFSLARQVGAVIDHSESASLYPFIAAARDGGAFLASPAEMRRRADRVLIVGDAVGECDVALLKMLAATAPDLGVRTRGAGRRLMTLGRRAISLPGSAEVTHLDCASDAITDVVGMVRAKLAGRRAGEGALGDAAVSTIATFLSEAGFAAVVFAPAEFGELGTEQIFGLVRDLNETTRASTLPVLGHADAMGAALLATWTSGFPLRVSYGRGPAEHDATLHASDRQLSGDGEADVVVFVDALAGAASQVPAFAMPAILISADPAAPNAARVVFKVAAAGRDHDGVLYDARFGSFVAKPAETTSELPTAAAILDALADQRAGRGAEAA
ncbi:hypothetical protein [Aurantimonas sp. 22II-16-19i]|uniref:hypothetical protein n=1 Tax=Aurantimonas sp. 22II-16-19i TaxID=1317114 RepID=UPI0009F7D400|nr:hypothetical protein [Aurantimonas sp. 22II-16-19i]ORE98712.1 tungsten-containing formylmethanofuran dehydrogenase subunit B [Aurantimonas sp. 22II-16-19i]